MSTHRYVLLRGKTTVREGGGGGGRGGGRECVWKERIGNKNEKCTRQGEGIGKTKRKNMEINAVEIWKVDKGKGREGKGKGDGRKLNSNPIALHHHLFHHHHHHHLLLLLRGASGDIYKPGDISRLESPILTRSWLWLRSSPTLIY